MRVTKKPGHMKSDLLSDGDEAQGGIWNSIANSFGAGGTDAQASETINIFSVASGHLYERLLRIMMLSLLKHTKVLEKFSRESLKEKLNFDLLFFAVSG